MPRRAERAGGRGTLAAALLWLLFSSAAFAQEPRQVVLASFAADTALSREVVVRLLGELRATGFDVELVSVEPSSDPASWLRSRVRRSKAVAGLALVSSEGADRKLQLWSLEANASELKRVELGERAGLDVSVLAVQLAEGLSARLERPLLASPPSLPSPPLPSEPPVARPLERSPTRVSMEGGAGSFLLPGTQALALLPVLRVAIQRDLSTGVGFPVGWSARLCAAALGTPVEFRSVVGRTRVQQQLFLLEGSAAMVHVEPALLYLLGAAGVHRVQVEAARDTPGDLEGVGAIRSSATVGAGLGGSLDLGRHLHARLEVEGLWAASPTAVELAGARAAVFGSPLVFASLSMGASF